MTRNQKENYKNKFLTRAIWLYQGTKKKHSKKCDRISYAWNRRWYKYKLYRNSIYQSVRIRIDRKDEQANRIWDALKVLCLLELIINISLVPTLWGCLYDPHSICSFMLIVAQDFKSTILIFLHNFDHLLMQHMCLN